MIKDILLIQFRNQEKISLHEKECIFRSIKKNRVKTINVFKEKFSFSKKNLSQFKKIILGGSGELSISEKKDKPDLWKKAKVISPIIKSNIPTLGICFGHQIIAYLLESEVVFDNSQKEVGTYKVFLTKKGEKDLLFNNIPREFYAQEGHKDSVKKLPKKAVLLARGEKCKIASFRFNNFYGVQFHPELKSKDVSFRLNLFPDYAEGVENSINLRSSPYVSKILENFVYKI